MRELTWKKFSETGCVETYLLLREIEERNAHPFLSPEMHAESFNSPEYTNLEK